VRLLVPLRSDLKTLRLGRPAAGHVFDELEDANPTTAEALIRKARATRVRPGRRSVRSKANENPG